MYFVARMVNLTVRAMNINFLEFQASAGPKVLISFLYGYVEGHMTRNDISWTDPLTNNQRFYFQKIIKNFIDGNNQSIGMSNSRLLRQNLSW